MNQLVYRTALVLALALPTVGWAQQDAQFSQYMFNGLFLNPATAGVDGLTRFQAIGRSQWTGYQSNFGDGGAPTTGIFSLNTPIARWRSGAGFYIINDQLGPYNNIQAQGSFAYHFPVRNGKLSLGISGGFSQLQIDFNTFRPGEPEAALQRGRESVLQPDMGIGLNYRTEKYYIGVSATHLLQPNFEFGSQLNRLKDNRLRSHLYATMGYNIDLTYQIVLTPSVLFKYDQNVAQVEPSVLATYNNKFWGGLSFRQGDAGIVMLGVNMLKDNALRFGYAFDFTVVGNAAKRPISNELMLTYTIQPPAQGKKVKVNTPRFKHEAK